MKFVPCRQATPNSEKVDFAELAPLAARPDGEITDDVVEGRSLRRWPDRFQSASSFLGWAGAESNCRQEDFQLYWLSSARIHKLVNCSVFGLDLLNLSICVRPCSRPWLSNWLSRDGGFREAWRRFKASDPLYFFGQATYRQRQTYKLLTLASLKCTCGATKHPTRRLSSNSR